MPTCLMVMGSVQFGFSTTNCFDVIEINSFISFLLLNCFLHVFIFVLLLKCSLKEKFNWKYSIGVDAVDGIG